MTRGALSCGPADALFASPADWVSPDGSYLTAANPPVASGNKVILADTDHIWGVGGSSDWMWRSFTRGNNNLYMDPYGEPGQPAADEGVRVAMGQTLTYAQKMDLIHMTPRGDLTSTSYALANPGTEYLVYQPAGGTFSVNLSGAAGTFAVEWFNPATGAVTAGAPLAGGGTATVSAPFSGPSVLYLRHA